MGVLSGYRIRTAAFGSLVALAERQKWGASATVQKRLPAKSLAQISVASDNERASSTSTPRYRTVFSILL